MFNHAKTLSGYKLQCLDGEIGTVDEFYFDDQFWTVRYLVANTGNWLTGNQVLISPYALGEVNMAQHHIAIGLRKKQIEESPSIATDMPVSQQFESEYYGYYGWRPYWTGSFMWGMYSYPNQNSEEYKDQVKNEKVWDPHLRSTRAVSGYNIQAADGEIGHVVDFIINDNTWAIRYLIVDIQNWWPGKKILISPMWIERVSWKDSKIFVDLSKEAIKSAPEYQEDSLPTRDYEIGLHKHYDRLVYWLDEPDVIEHSHLRAMPFGN